MPESDLPKNSKSIVRSHDVDEIAKALRNVLEGSLSSGYSDQMVPISGRPSGQMIYPQHHVDAIKKIKGLSPTEVAMKIVYHGMWEYPPRPGGDQRWEKGWEIIKAMSEDDEPYAIVRPAWVTPPLHMPVFI